jgi:acyl-CoA synthetase (AMP-forming)/AMP-acid ligase II
MTALVMHALMDSAAERYPCEVAVRHGVHTYTFAELVEVSYRVARTLQDKGIQRGDRVCLSVRARIETVPLIIALSRIGAALAPVNPELPDERKKSIIERFAPALIVGDEPYASSTLQQLVDVPAGPVRVLGDVDDESTCLIYLTSGTTGEPKGVEVSHRAEYVRALHLSVNEPRGPFVCMFPQFHMAGWMLPFAHWASGEQVIFVDGGDTAGLVAAVAKYRAHRIYAIPAVLRRIMDSDLSQYDMSSLRIVDTGTSYISPELLAEIHETFPGASTSVYYGSSEAGVVCALRPGQIDDHPGSVGLPISGARVRISDTGELQVTGPFLFKGYLDNPDATANALVDGWYNTGDLAERDGDGFVTIKGRTREIIRTGGESVAPDVVERGLRDHPAIADIAVAGVPDEYWGEIVTAFVVARSGQSVDLAALRAHCRDSLAPPYYPRRLELVHDIPRSAATGQVQRHRLVSALTDTAATDTQERTNG